MPTTVIEKQKSPDSQEPLVVQVDGLGEVRGWDIVGADNMISTDLTKWELEHGVDVLGPDFEKYNRRHERFVCDWDDNFKDTGKWWVVAHREVLLSFGFSEEETIDEKILSLFGNIHVGNTLGIERFVKDGKEYTDDEVWGLIKGRAGELLAEHPMDPLLVEVLKRAVFWRDLDNRSIPNKKYHSGPRFAVWSSSPRELLETAIEANGLQDVFDAVVSVDDVEKHKPDPEGLYKAVHAMDVASGYLEEDETYSDEKPLQMNGVWMLGDSPNDVKGGKSAGASTLWIEHPLQAHSALNKRQAALANLSLEETEIMAETLRPTASIRVFDPREAGLHGKLSVGQVPFEEIASLSTDTTTYARFLQDKDLRERLYRQDKVYQALRAQGLRGKDSAVLKNVFAEEGDFSQGIKTEKGPMTPDQIQEWFDKTAQEIDADYVGFGY
ncbi:MAG TPA: HAD hydrolase-like protein [Candidatus Saccharibacteria bacterium]|nr:HAD hydrolase-like protein [Candidatus Saccharibacteria bacterium]HRK94626.1 HAD hydrolase-like protein [Candidatus Saccharibacteria bacterium]